MAGLPGLTGKAAIISGIKESIYRRARTFSYLTGTDYYASIINTLLLDPIAY